MALPNVPAWIFDYPAARKVVDGGDDDLLQAVQQLAADGRIRICHCEAADFKRHNQVKDLFCPNGGCILDLEPQIVQVASALPTALNGKILLVTDIYTPIIVATAIAASFGIVSSRSGGFLTAVELGVARGVTALTLDQFRAML